MVGQRVQERETIIVFLKFNKTLVFIQSSIELYSPCRSSQWSTGTVKELWRGKRRSEKPVTRKIAAKGALSRIWRVWLSVQVQYCHLESSCNEQSAWVVKSMSHETSTREVRHTPSHRTPTWLPMCYMMCQHLALREHCYGWVRQFSTKVCPLQ